VSSRKFVPEHLGISVADLEQSVKWYHEVLGFELERQEYAAPMKSHVAFMHNGPFRLEIFAHDDTLPVPEERRTPNLDIRTQGTKHLCFLHEDVPGLARELEQIGVEIVFGPACNGSQHMIFIRDINGILIEIVSNM